MAASLVFLLTVAVMPTHALATESVVADVRDGPCRMVVSGEGAIFSLEVRGLVPEENVSFESVSNGERMLREVQASSAGTYSATLFAAVEGDQSGTDTVTVTGSRCTLSATFRWSTGD